MLGKDRVQGNGSGVGGVTCEGCKQDEGGYNSDGKKWICHYCGWETAVKKEPKDGQ